MYCTGAAVCTFMGRMLPPAEFSNIGIYHNRYKSAASYLLLFIPQFNNYRFLCTSYRIFSVNSAINL